MKQRARRVPWQWTGRDLVLDDDEEQVWICPDLPPAAERGRRPLKMDITYWASDLPIYAALPSLNRALFDLWTAFAHDSVLAAIRRREPSNYLLLYTAAPKGIADRRYDDIRQALRPLSMGIEFTQEPGWDSLERLLWSVGRQRAAGQR